MQKTRHAPYWLDRFPSSRRPSFDRQRGAARAGICIVGGGLTGCAAAQVFAAAGVDVILLEAERLGAAGAAESAGILRPEPDAAFAAVASAHGLRAARQIWQTTRRAALDFAATLRRLNIRCDLTPQDSIVFPRAAADEKALRKEYQARREAGLDVTWVNGAALRRETAMTAVGAMRLRDAAQLDPYRACVGLAAAAAARGAQIFEGSPARRIRAGRKAVEIRTASGTVHAQTVLIATGEPTADFKALRRHFRREDTYLVVTEPLPAATGREVGRRATLLRDLDEPPHFLRWLRDDRVMFAGADRPSVPDRLGEKTIVQRTGQLMYELSTWYPAVSGIMPAWSWRTRYGRTVDALPYLGPHRNYPRHLFALGAGRHGLGYAYLAARIALRQHLGKPDQGDELFAFVRTLSHG
ncbi:MAG: FAD-binding oxidoreductase [Acidobacteria bacterium]|nr:FAD-binding oxidoreductase [Acidobacteriota bacterium]